ncbi:MAG: serine/threonine protein kinase [Acidobacteria bacterium]|nr:serine/threonine protein kinase [Acidobacteriota bacterium]
MTNLCYVSVIAAVSTILFVLLHVMLQPEAKEVIRSPFVRLTDLSLVLLSVGFVVLQRSGVLSKQAILHLGAVFQVLVAFTIALVESYMPRGPEMPVIGVSSVALWITLCGVLIPNTPLVNMLAGFFSVLAWPSAYLIARQLFDSEFIGWNRVAIWMSPLAMSAIWTNLLNRRMYAMTVASQRAEDMGSYQLDYKIGEGGMGEVWRAKHRLLARDAAVKLIRTDVMSGVNMKSVSLLRKRFEREARSTASLRSPHTVALFDFGVTKDHTFYYVMELLDGLDLQTMVENYGPLPAARVKNILLQVCESLDEAHTLGMVHRDIKPRNIFLCKLGSRYDFSKVLDFGLVKNMLQPEDTLMTADGAATGTPAYMAPEVALGGTVDGRADIYALGCVAYYLLTGQMVFQESSSTAVVLAHVQKEPVSPSLRTELPIPPELDALILKSLAKNPQDRIHSAAEFARQLEAIEIRPKYCPDDARRWWGTHLPTIRSRAAEQAHDEAVETSDTLEKSARV